MQDTGKGILRDGGKKRKRKEKEDRGGKEFRRGYLFLGPPPHKRRKGTNIRIGSIPPPYIFYLSPPPYYQLRQSYRYKQRKSDRLKRASLLVLVGVVGVLY